MNNIKIDRRGALAASGALALIALARANAAGSDTELSAAEKANVQLIESYVQNWREAPPDQDKFNSLISDDCVWKIATLPPAVGRDACLKVFRSYVRPNEKTTIDVLHTFAKGPVVVHARLDGTVSPTKTSKPIPVVAVFVIRNGKIHDFGEYPY